MLRRIGLGAFVLYVLCANGAFAQSNALVNVLTETQQLSSNDFGTLCSWARSGASAPLNTYFQPQKTMADILALADKDRLAVLLWLQGNGRSALYAQGASDYQVGPRRSPADRGAATPSPAPAAWREIPLATATLNGDVQGPIQVLGGFAAVKRDGTAAVACLSFKNIGSGTINRVMFDISLYDSGGNDLGALTLDRNGEFSVQVPIMTYDSFGTWDKGTIGPRGYNDNCIQKTLPTPAMPLLRARSASYHLTRAQYDNGNVWMEGMPTPH